MKTLFKYGFIILVILVVLAFVGVQPLADHKEKIIHWIGEIELPKSNLKNNDKAFSPVEINLPFDMEIVSAKAGSNPTDHVVITFIFNANDETVLDETYWIFYGNIDNPDGGWMVGFKEVDETFKKEWLFTGDTAQDIRTNVESEPLRQLEVARSELRNAQDALDRNNAKSEEILYDWWMGRKSAPSYDTVQKLEQQHKELISDVKTTQSMIDRLVRELEMKHEVIVSIVDILPYLMITSNSVMESGGSLNDIWMGSEVRGK